MVFATTVAKRSGRHLTSACLVALVLTGTANARDEWFHSLDLEPRLSEASLVLVARVADISQTKVMMGGKAETELVQFKFDPIFTLKGVYSRDSLSLTSQDLGVQFLPESAPVERGELRLLILGRSNEGYSVFRQAASLEQAVPPLTGPSDPLIETVRILLAVNGLPDRADKIVRLIAGLRTQRGPSAIPLLASLERRPLLAAQTSGVADAISPHFDDPSSAVREQAANTLNSLLEADYLGQTALRENAVKALAISLRKPDPNVAARVSALRALGAAGLGALDHSPARALLRLDARATYAEQGALLHATGQLKTPGEQALVLAVFRQAPLDAPADLQSGMEWALGQLDPAAGANEIAGRLKSKYDAGLPVATEIASLSNLPPANAVPVLADVSAVPLDREERYAFAGACGKVAEQTLNPQLGARLITPLANMLSPTERGVRELAIDALLRIDSDAAAKALEPHLADETDLGRKLEIAGFLGRHGIRDGYPYAIEHMSEPWLRERAIDALASIRDPRATDELRHILDTSNDAAWSSAAVRALGRLGISDLAPKFLAIARDARNPIAPSALLALGDLGEIRAIELVRAGLASRSSGLLAAAARAAGKLAALPGVNANDVRDQLASLLADPAAPLEARDAAFDSLFALHDPRLNTALTQAERDSGLENAPLLVKIEKTLRERKVKVS